MLIKISKNTACEFVYIFSKFQLSHCIFKWVQFMSEISCMYSEYSIILNYIFIFEFSSSKYTKIEMNRFILSLKCCRDKMVYSIIFLCVHKYFNFITNIILLL